MLSIVISRKFSDNEFSMLSTYMLLELTFPIVREVTLLSANFFIIVMYFVNEDIKDIDLNLLHSEWNSPTFVGLNLLIAKIILIFY